MSLKFLAAGSPLGGTSLDFLSLPLKTGLQLPLLRPLHGWEEPLTDLKLFLYELLK